MAAGLIGFAIGIILGIAFGYILCAVLYFSAPVRYEESIDKETIDKSNIVE